MALNYNELSSLTRRKFRTPVINQIKESDPLLEKILDKKKTFSGTKLVIPIKHDHLNVSEYAPYDGTNDFNIAKKEIHTAAEYEAKGIAVNLTIDGFEDAQNSGREAVASMMKEKKNDLAETAQVELARSMLGGINGKKPVGLAEALKVDNTYGGIDRLTNSFWQPKQDANGGTARALTLKMLNNMWVKATNGGQEAKGLYILVGFDVYNKIYDLVEATYRKVDVQEVSKIGMRAIIFNGTPILASPYVADNDVRFVNVTNFGFDTLAGRDFHFTDFKPAQANDTMVQQLLVGGNFYINKARTHGLIKDIDPTL